MCELNELNGACPSGRGLEKKEISLVLKLKIKTVTLTSVGKSKFFNVVNKYVESQFGSLPTRDRSLYTFKLKAE